MAKIERTAEQVEAMSDRMDTSGATRFRGMSFEQGVVEALQWVLGDNESLEAFQPEDAA